MTVLQHTVLLFLLFIASISDIKTKTIPDWISMAGTAFFIITESVSRGSFPFTAAGGGLLGFTVFMCTRIISGRRLGMGDVKLSALTGAALGIKGWYPAAAAAVTAALAFSLVMIMLKKFNFDTKLPFAPFLFIGALAAVIFLET
jgi:leader peptidase (prepilin peptidase)/N-methyltransferase